jgi:hypothetical protein
MKHTYKYAIYFLLLFSTLSFAEGFKISGNVTSENSGEALLGANVYIKALNMGAVTDMKSVT